MTTKFSRSSLDYWLMFVKGIEDFTLTIEMPCELEGYNPERFISFLTGLVYEKEWTTLEDPFDWQKSKLVSAEIYNQLFPELSPNKAKEEFELGMLLFVNGINKQEIEDRSGLLESWGLQSSAKLFFSQTVKYKLKRGNTEIHGTFISGMCELNDKKYIYTTPYMLNLATGLH